METHGKVEHRAPKVGAFSSLWIPIVQQTPAQYSRSPAQSVDEQRESCAVRSFEFPHYRGRVVLHRSGSQMQPIRDVRICESVGDLHSDIAFRADSAFSVGSSVSPDPVVPDFRSSQPALTQSLQYSSGAFGTSKFRERSVLKSCAIRA